MASTLPTEHIRAQARSWLLHLQAAEPRTEDIADWRAWLEADARHAAAYDEAVAAWELALQTPMAPAGAAELVSDRYDGAVPVREWRRRKPRWRLSAAAALAASAIVGVVVLKGWFAEPDAPARQVASGRGERELVLLADGSKVTLGGLTTVEIRYTRRERELLLAKGQAAFEVAHAQARPFVVKTRLADVKAIGTAFDVNVRDQSLILAVTEGVVEVDPLPRAGVSPRGVALQPLRVSAGQTLILGRDGARLQRELPFGGGWTEGWLAYRNEPLSAVIEDVNRYAQTPIRLRDPSLGELAYTGTVELSNVNAWVAALPDAFSIEIRRTADEIVLEKKIGRRLPDRGSRPS